MQRMFSRRLAGATAGLLLTATSPFAADLTPPPPLPPPVPVWTWTGFELGVQAGGGIGKTTVDLLGFQNTYNTHGAFGGLHLGYNYQFSGPLVIGLQLEYNFAGITGTSFNFPVNYQRTDIAEFGSADGRIGLAFDRVLIYGIGGFAYGDIRNQINCGVVLCGAFIPFAGNGGLLPFPVSVTRDFAANRYGYDVGGGIEYALTDNWMVRAEYRYYNWKSRGFNDAGFGTFVAPFVTINPFAIAIPNHRDKEILHTGRIGLSYKFAWPPAPVVAKY
jgi:outer membrane immunogenic protein